MKTIWFLTNFTYPIIPPRCGTASRVYNLAKVLLMANYKVNMLSFAHGSNEIVRTNGITEWRIRGVSLPNQMVWQRFLNRLGFTILGRPTNFWVINFNSWVESLLRKVSCDVIVCEQIWIAPLVRKIASRLRVPMIIDSHNFETEIYYRYFKDLARRYGSLMNPLRVLAYRLLSYEREILKQADIIACVSRRDKRKFIQLGILPKKILVVPNGVDINAFSPSPSKPSSLRSRLCLPIEKPIVLFLGSHTYQANIDAVRDIIKIIAPAVKEAYFVIIGRGWRPKRHKNVFIIGEVNDVSEYLQAADILIAPLRYGGGTKIKVLEYLAAGKPIIGTPLAFEGIAITPEAVVVEKNIQNFSHRIIELTRSPALVQKLVTAARSTIEPYAWHNTATALVDWLQEQENLPS